MTVKNLKAYHHRGTEGTEFYLLTTPTAQLTIQSFSLCLCGELFLIFIVSHHSNW